MENVTALTCTVFEFEQMQGEFLTPVYDLHLAAALQSPAAGTPHNMNRLFVTRQTNKSWADELFLIASHLCKIAAESAFVSWALYAI